MSSENRRGPGIIGWVSLTIGAVVMLMLVPGIGAADSASAPETSLVVHVADGRDELTVVVRGVPLTDVLCAVGEATGVDVRVLGDASGAVTASLIGVPLEEGIRRLARGYSVAVTYGAASTSGEPRLTRVWVVGRSTREPSEPAQVVAVPVPQAPSSLEDRSREIQTLVNDADRGSAAAVGRLANLGASEPSAVVREQAVAALGRLTGAEIELALTAALDDADAAVRVRAVRGLRGTGTETAVASLARASTDDTDPEVRLAALSALMSFPGPTMAQGLVRAVADPDGRVRDAAARGLTWWNARRSGAP